MKKDTPSPEFVNQKLSELQGIIKHTAKRLNQKIGRRIIGFDYCLSRCYQIAWNALRHIPESRWKSSPEEAKTIFCRSLWKWSRNPHIEANLRDLAGLDRIDKNGVRHRSPVNVSLISPLPVVGKDGEDFIVLDMLHFNNPKEATEPDFDDITPVLNRIADQIELEMLARLERNHVGRKHIKENKEALQAVLMVLRGSEPFTRFDFYKKWTELLGVKKRQRQHRSQCWFMHQIIKRIKELLEEGVTNTSSIQ